MKGKILVATAIIAGSMYAGDKLDASSFFGYFSSNRQIVSVSPLDDIGNTAKDLYQKLKQQENLGGHVTELRAVVYATIDKLDQRAKEGTILGIVLKSEKYIRMDVMNNAYDSLDYETQANFVKKRAANLNYEDKQDLFFAVGKDVFEKNKDVAESKAKEYLNLGSEKLKKGKNKAMELFNEYYAQLIDLWKEIPQKNGSKDSDEKRWLK